MFQVRCIESRVEKPTRIYARYSIGPFLRGEADTVFPVLRRVMMRNLEGIAVVAVHIKGIDHEFSVIQNTKEDVMSLLLNLRNLIFKGFINEPQRVKCKLKGPGIFLASDIQLPVGVSFVDPRQYIAHVTSESDLEIEFVIAKGQGYVPSGKLTHIVPKNFFAIDGIFMPIVRVAHYTEILRTTSSLPVEVVNLEIGTNGSILPEEAMQFSAEILKSTFDYLLRLDLPTNSTYESYNLLNVSDDVVLDLFGQTETSSISKQAETPIENLGLRTRAFSCLQIADIKTIGDLMTWSSEDILRLPNCGPRTLNEIKDELKQTFNLDLK
jgi:DNA-directed RNA polymerase subunit alpha